MMARNILESFKLLTNVSRLFAQRCIAGLTVTSSTGGCGLTVDRDTVEFGHRLRGGGRRRQASTQGTQNDSPNRDRPWLISDRLSIEDLDRRLDVLAMAKAEQLDSDRL